MAEEKESLIARLTRYWNNLFIRSLVISSLLFTIIGVGITFIPLLNAGITAFFLSIGLPLPLAGPFLILGAAGLLAGVFIGTGIGLLLSRRGRAPGTSLKNVDLELENTASKSRSESVPSDELGSLVELGSEPDSKIEIEEFKGPELEAIISPEQIAIAADKLKAVTPAFENQAAALFFEAIAQYIDTVFPSNPSNKILALKNLFSAENKQILAQDRLYGIQVALEDFTPEELKDEKMKPLISALAQYKIAVLNRLNVGAWSILPLLKLYNPEYNQEGQEPYEKLAKESPEFFGKFCQRLFQHLSPKDAEDFYKKFMSSLSEIKIKSAPKSNPNQKESALRITVLENIREGMEDYFNPERVKQREKIAEENREARKQLFGKDENELDSLLNSDRVKFPLPRKPGGPSFP